jgi:hypothetical protein
MKTEKHADWIYFPEYRQVMTPGGTVCEVHHDGDGPLLASAPALLAACKESSAILEAVAIALESGFTFDRAKCVADLRRVADMNDAAVIAAEPEGK